MVFMEKKVYLFVMFALIALFVISTVSAEIIISQPSASYNLGDTLSFGVTLNPHADTNDFLTADIVCNNGQVNIYKSSFDLQAFEQQNLTVQTKLNKNLIGDLDGSCYLDTRFGSDEQKSTSFELSNRIDVLLAVSNSTVDPGQRISVSGNATKSDGSSANGFAQISIPGTNSTIISTISNGAFSDDIYIPANAASGAYYLTVNAYERDSSGSLTNQGSASSTIRVNQIIKKVDVAIDNPSIYPSSNLSYTALLYDQTDNQATLDTPVLIYNPNGTLYTQQTVKSGDLQVLSLPYDAAPGQWTIEVYYNNLAAKHSFNIESVSKNSFSLDNQTLVVTNTGNVPYSGNVQVKMGDNVQTLAVNLGVDQEKRFKLSAPDGSYAISAGDGQNSAIDLGNSYLTGNAVAIQDISTLSSGSFMVFWIWFIIIIVLVAIALYYYRKVRKNNYVGKTPSFNTMNMNRAHSPTKKLIPIDKSSFPTKEIDNEVKKGRLETYNPEATALSAALNGSKEEVSVIALKIKNAAKLRDAQSSAFLTIEHLMQKARQQKAKVYDQGLFRIIIFSPRITMKTDLENTTNAVKLAWEIDAALKEFNKKYAVKIDYGLGAHIGQMFLEFVEGKVKFTSAGNATVVAKNAAEKANNELFLSSLFHRKVYNIVKGDQTQYGLYKVTSLLDRSQHSQFIQRFMKKNDKK